MPQEYNDKDFIIKNDYFSHSGRPTLFEYKGKEKDVVIPKDAKIIKARAFEDKDSIGSITFHHDIKVIESYALLDCHNLRQVKFEGNPLVAHGDAFKGCDNVECIILPYGCSYSLDLANHIDALFKDSPSYKVYLTSSQHEASAEYSVISSPKKFIEEETKKALIKDDIAQLLSDSEPNSEYGKLLDLSIAHLEGDTYDILCNFGNTTVSVGEFHLTAYYDFPIKSINDIAFDGAINFNEEVINFLADCIETSPMQNDESLKNPLSSYDDFHATLPPKFIPNLEEFLNEQDVPYSETPATVNINVDDGLDEH